MDLKPVIDALWEATQQGIYYPPEWQGKFDVEDGYRVQLGLLARHVKGGATHAGWKVGLTAKAIQDQIGHHEPVFGFLLESGHRPSGVVIPADDLVFPSFETELCLTLGEPLRGPEVTLEQARAAIAEAAPALEIVERRGDFAADLPLAVADNVQQRYFITGASMPVRAGKPSLAKARVEIFINGESMEQAGGTAVMGDPAASVAWLANRLAALGERLEAGARIMSGSLTKQYPVAQGNVVEARFDPFGDVTAEFS